ncbi:hypothetical protein JGI9_01991 [Candidatus Kryptonium thompsonii]|nr:hypothetical protein JGI9_01991 [Candidatus Kryptonium thompsoni]
MIIYTMLRVVIPQFPDDVVSSVNIPDLFFPALVLLGLVLGFVGSWISARKYITYKLIS